MTEAQLKKIELLESKESLTEKQQIELDNLLSILASETETVSNVTTQSKSFITNTNFKGINEESEVIKAGLLFPKAVNLSINVISVAFLAEKNCYAIKCDDSLTEEPLDCFISKAHYDGFHFNELLPVAVYKGKHIKVKGVHATTQHGYFDKTSGQVVAYWKNAFFITEPRQENSESELNAKREILSTVQIKLKTFEMFMGCKFDPANPLHQTTLSNIR